MQSLHFVTFEQRFWAEILQFTWHFDYCRASFNLHCKSKDGLIRGCIIPAFFPLISHCFLNSSSKCFFSLFHLQLLEEAASIPSSRWPSGIQQTRSLRFAVFRESRELGVFNQHPQFFKCLGCHRWCCLPSGSNPLQSILITLFPCWKFGYHRYNEMLTVGGFKCFQCSGTGWYHSQETVAFTVAFTR